jgi:hypothetical protein
VANVVIFGGAIAYDGDVIEVKGAGQGRQGPSMTFEPMFMAIVLRIGWYANTADIAEIQLGNLNQGLILTLFAGEEPLYHIRRLGSYNFDGWTIHADYNVYNEIIRSYPGEFTGFIKDALVGYWITPFGSDSPIDAAARLDMVEWSMPLARDDDLLGRIGF